MGATDFGNPDHVIHIPARDLRGTRAETLADLDLLLTQLQVVRSARLGQVVEVDGAVDCDSHPRNAVRPGTPAMIALDAVTCAAMVRTGRVLRPRVGDA